MASPSLVADCFDAMQAVSDVPVTVKCRIGIDDQDSDTFLADFIGTLFAAGCRKFIVHARIAILNGLSPKENRTVPPLDYERVYRMKQAFSDAEVVINGGLTTIEAVDAALVSVDGAMIGRQAYHQPYFLAELEKHFDPDYVMPSRDDVVLRMLPYVDAMRARDVPLNSITRHMLGLFAGQPGARSWRRYLSENVHRDGAGAEVLENALAAMPVAA